MAPEDNYWNRRMETLSREEISSLQLKKLRGILEICSHSPYYRRIFKEEKIDPSRIEDFDDLRRIPFTDKNILRENPSTDFLAVPREEIIRLHSTSGTTGQAIVIYYTRSDIQTWAEMIARCMYMNGVRRGDVFQNMIGYGLFTGGLGFHYGAELVGVLTIPSGAGNSRRQIQLMREHGTTVAHVIPSYALLLTEVFEEMGLDPREDTNLRILFIGAEPHSEDMRQRIEEIYGVDAYNSYGLTEMNGPGVAFECPHKQGMHLWEDHYILEVIDPQTLERVPEGEEGELVLTTLSREGMPILRYRTRDLASVIPGECPCGRKHRRISRIKGRSDDMFIIKGVNVFPLQVEEVLMKTLGVGSNYQIHLERVGVREEMKVLVEVTGELWHGNPSELRALQERIRENLRSAILLTPLVELVEAGSITKSEGKAVRVVDKRGNF